jgi:hypothetical protein
VEREQTLEQDRRFRFDHSGQGSGCATSIIASARMSLIPGDRTGGVVEKTAVMDIVGTVF